MMPSCVPNAIVVTGTPRSTASATAALAGLGLVVVGFAEPVRDEEQSTEQVTIVLALDVSLSMMAEDVSPDRLAAAKEAAIDFVDSVPDDVAIVLVDFAGSARVRVAATTDKAELVAAIESLHLREGTAIGEAIFTGLDPAIRRMRQLMDAARVAVPA